ncbi:FecCD family ABC transporter permease [Actinopolymorpha alba]|uniref:FecCD family ABC transporter permease n=1 Tax=Actinopolymorpha alba TaxID=533267 RepID=UPI0003792DAE|nr:iron chelate uptake ABC transporter family permease subunit [Actinopolymorpha alba]
MAAPQVREPAPPESAEPAVRPPRSTRGFVLRGAGLLVVLGVLALTALVSVAVGSRQIPLGTVLDVLVHRDSSNDAIVVWDLRIPRTLLGIAVGAALGLAGALMQALTRNPLADPGLLGVNAGAATAVVVAIAFLGLSSPTAYVWCALLGAAVAAGAVYLLGSQGRGGASPVRLALAGTAITAALTAFISAITLTNTDVFDQYRFWAVGALAGRDASVLGQVVPFLAVGTVLGLALARPLNAVALGEDTARALGAHLGRTRILGAVAITLLCGAATAAVGPIGFVGLTIPHIARAITGPDQRWVLSYSVVLAPILLLASDILGRIVARPGEVEVGIVTAALGAPFFIALVRRRRIAQL